MSSAAIMDRPLPHSLEAESSVLGAILLGGAISLDQMLRLSPSDFYSPRNGAIYSAMLRFKKNGKPTDDPIILADFLNTTAANFGWLAYLSEIVGSLPRATNWEHYAETVRRRSRLRQIANVFEAGIGRIQSATSIPSEDDYDILRDVDCLLERIRQNSTVPADLFDSYDEFVNAVPAKFAIEGFLQCEAPTLIAGLAGHFKTWVMLSIVKALLDDSTTKLWDTFDVKEKSQRCIYLIPESSRGAFKYRLEQMQLMEHVRSGRLLIRTLSKGPAPKLQDPRLLHFAEGADVVLDTAIRFMSGDENSAGDSNRGLAADIFALLSAGARLAVCAAHSQKSFEKENYMSLENMVRGSGDIGAMAATAWGVRQLPGDIAHIENIKHRDFDPCGPFQLSARPSINDIGDFRMWKPPGQCSALAEEKPDTIMPDRNKGGGAPVFQREAKVAKLELLRSWLAIEPRLSSQQAVQKFAQMEIKVEESSIRKYRKALGL
jgi:DnaB helicase-like protein/AAA domain-containing protein